MKALKDLNDYSGAFTVLLTLALVVITTVYVVITWKLLAESKASRESASRPEVAIWAAVDDVHFWFIYLRIENIGGGPAFNVSFKIDQPTGRARGNTEEEDLQSLGLFRKGLSFLPPRQPHRVLLGPGVSGFDETPPLHITASYADAAGTKHTRSFQIDYSEFWGLTRVGDLPLVTIAEAAKSIKDDLNSLVTGMRRLEVVALTGSEADREKRMTQLWRRMRGLKPEEYPAAIAAIQAIVERRGPDKGGAA
jgi:hypothetical protein